MVPSYRRHALRGYELYFHLLCWPVPAALAGTVAYLDNISHAGSWCGWGSEYTHQYLICFYLPLTAAFTFNVVTYAAVLTHSRERRVSRITSLYLLGFAVVWLPSLICRTQVFLSESQAPPFMLAALKAVCMPLQGALNAVVYCWSLPSIRDVYRAMLLGTHGINSIGSDDRLLSGQSTYSPPQPDRGNAMDGTKPPTHAVSGAATAGVAAARFQSLTSAAGCDGGSGRVPGAVEAQEVTTQLSTASGVMYQVSQGDRRPTG